MRLDVRGQSRGIVDRGACRPGRPARARRFRTLQAGIAGVLQRGRHRGAEALGIVDQRPHPGAERARLGRGLVEIPQTSRRVCLPGFVERTVASADGTCVLRSRRCERERLAQHIRQLERDVVRPAAQRIPSLRDRLQLAGQRDHALCIDRRHERGGTLEQAPAHIVRPRPDESGNRVHVALALLEEARHDRESGLVRVRGGGHAHPRGEFQCRLPRGLDDLLPRVFGAGQDVSHEHVVVEAEAGDERLIDTPRAVLEHAAEFAVAEEWPVLLERLQETALGDRLLRPARSHHVCVSGLEIVGVAPRSLDARRCRVPDVHRLHDESGRQGAVDVAPTQTPLLAALAEPARARACEGDLGPFGEAALARAIASDNERDARAGRHLECRLVPDTPERTDLDAGEIRRRHFGGRRTRGDGGGSRRPCRPVTESVERLLPLARGEHVHREVVVGLAFVEKALEEQVLNQGCRHVVSVNERQSEIEHLQEQPGAGHGFDPPAAHRRPPCTHASAAAALPILTPHRGARALGRWRYPTAVRRCASRIMRARRGGQVRGV